MLKTAFHSEIFRFSSILFWGDNAIVHSRSSSYVLVKSDRSAQVSQFGEHCVTHSILQYTVSQSEFSVQVMWPCYQPIRLEKWLATITTGTINDVVMRCFLAKQFKSWEKEKSFFFFREVVGTILKTKEKEVLDKFFCPLKTDMRTHFCVFTLCFFLNMSQCHF